MDCATSNKPMQLYLDSNGYGLYELDLSNGQYTQQYKLIKNGRTFPTYTGYLGTYSIMNAAALSTVDSIPYASLSIDSGNHAAGYLVRFDSNTIKFVAHMRKISFAGCIDDLGDYYYVETGTTVTGARGSIMQPLWKIAAPHNLDGYDAITQLTGSILTDSTLVDSSETGVSANKVGIGVSDITALYADLTNAGSKQRYVLGIQGWDTIVDPPKIILLRYSGTPKAYRLTSSNIEGLHWS